MPGGISKRDITNNKNVMHRAMRRLADGRCGIGRVRTARHSGCRTTRTGGKSVDIDTTKLRELLDAIDKIEEAIRNTVNGEVKETKQNKCGTCGEPGHSSRTCKRELKAENTAKSP